MEYNSAYMLTDFNWYKILCTKDTLPLVNFWTPTVWKIEHIKPDFRVYFMLKQKYGRKICGYGDVDTYRSATIYDAWERYGTGNGVESLEDFYQRVSGYVNKNTKHTFNPNNDKIGCIILKNTVFFPENEWVDASSIGQVPGKNFLTFTYVKETKPHVIKRRVAKRKTKETPPFELVDGSSKWRSQTVKDREGQKAFRNMVLKCYNNRCCISGVNTTEVLQAAHIQTYRNRNSNHIQNGLLLRSDLHALFDNGLMTIENGCVKISSQVTATEYLSLDGKPVNLPQNSDDRPSVEALAWHNKNIFRG